MEIRSAILARKSRREISISTSVVPIEWEGVKINILDTPGFFDFVGEVEEAVSAADAAIIVISGKAGVEVGTQKAWELCDRYKLPRMVFVTDMDIDNASYRQIVEDMTNLYGKKIAPFHLPIRENEKFVGYINVISETGYRWQGKEVVECDIPEYNKPNLQICRDTLMEAVAETSEEFMERYLAAIPSPKRRSERRCVPISMTEASFPCPWAPTSWDRASIRCWMIS